MLCYCFYDVFKGCIIEYILKFKIIILIMELWRKYIEEV